MSLFPFLAVLICTMGALIVLFVVMVLQARTDAVAVDPPALAIPAKAQPSEPQPDYSEQLAELEALRQKRLAQLEEARLRLSGLEDHSHRLTEKIRKLRGEVAVLEGKTTNVTGSADDVETQKQRLNQQIAEAQAELEKVREQLKSRKPTYALVPYDGRSGTRRQQIYIECTAERVIIQPEGIGLTGADFLPPLGAGNPLASALRTIREYRQSQGIPGQGNPYPLLIVRPGGAESYAAAREALQGWDDEFGYELVDDETELAYPPADRFLVKRLIETVELARRRKLDLIMAAPKQYGRVEDQYLIASRNSGFRSAGGSGEAEGFLENRFVQGGQGSGTETGQAWGGSSTGGSAETTDSPRERQPSGDTPGGGFYSANNASGQFAADGQQGSPHQAGAQAASQGGTPQNGGAGGSRTSLDPLAAKRGSNWALPDATPRSTGITRPIRLVCGPTQMTLVPERGVTQPAETVPVDADLEAAADKLVRHVQSRIESWGIAGRNFYWKPVLQVTVEQGGDATYRQLETLLYGSGIEVKRQ